MMVMLLLTMVEVVVLGSTTAERIGQQRLEETTITIIDMADDYYDADTGGDDEAVDCDTVVILTMIL